VCVQFRFGAQKKSAHSELLKLTDELRDSILPALGIRIEDKSDGAPAVWKLDNPAGACAALHTCTTYTTHTRPHAGRLRVLIGALCVRRAA